ncbi:Pentatricopeptide repeat-containing protein [Raphanus sativus]|uniref:Pentatricopeptide repeat-containing protein At3g49740 n=1 Tax=Raphanus sativus TaxID=3726 RepID=A0A6J0N1F2_RAPSA|nr:pentatricopeptide repeat-containing protein At3g49740 [Raphanus sativus]KAJ4868815.1 Pentatricopeptide repeat-containing protein [Raphanus sativus]
MRKALCLTESLSPTSTTLLDLNRRLTALTRSGSNANALNLFADIHRSTTLNPDHYTLSSAITAASHLRDPTVSGGQLHSYAVRSGLSRHSHVSNTLLSLYAGTSLLSLKKSFLEIEHPDVYSWTTLLAACFKLGEIDYAFKVFDEMPERNNAAVWNAMITGCKEKGYYGTSMELFREMHVVGVGHDKFGFSTVLSVCCLRFGRQVHSLVVKAGFLSASSVVNAVITMYFNGGVVSDACSVFEEAGVGVRDQVTFNVVIDGLAGLRRGEPLLVFREMLESGLRPTDLTFVSVMSSCSCAGMGRQVHGLAIKTGYEEYTLVSNSAMSMYSSFEDLVAARKVFESLREKDLVTWNTMISGYNQARLGESAVSVYKRMHGIGVKPDEFTFGSLLASSLDLDALEMVQACVIKFGLSSKMEVSNALISAYSKQSEIAKADLIFGGAPKKNLISWNAMISGLYHNGLPFEGLKRFSRLLETEVLVLPDAYTLSILLSICVNISSLMLGKQAHAYVIRHGLFEETLLGNALINMYSQCGTVQKSLQVFNQMSEKDVVSWNSLISAYARHGGGESAVVAFKTMQEEGEVDADAATFTAVLSACSHSGLVEEGLEIFNSIAKPSADHFSCLVDLLGRAGYLDEAGSLVKKMSGCRVDALWGLFSACAAHGDLKLGKMVARLLMEQEKDDPSSVYVQLSNIYAGAGLWKEAEETREAMNLIGGAMKQRGCSWMRL